MRTKRAFKNAVTGLLLQITLALSGFLLPRFFIALYGSPVNGLASSISQFIGYISLAEAGVGAAGTVALYDRLARSDTDGVNRVLSAARHFYLRSGVIFAALAGLLTLLYPAVVQSEISDASFVRVMILALSVNGVVDYFYLGKYRVLLVADQCGYVISVIQIIGTLAMTAVSIGLMTLHTSALTVKWAAAGIYLLRSGAVGLYVHRRYPNVNFHVAPDRAAFSQRWAALLHQIVGMIVTNTDVILLTLLLHEGALVEVSVYTVYNMVSYALIGLLNSLSTALTSGFGQVIAAGEKDTLIKSFRSYEYAFFPLIFLVFSVMAVLLYPFIGLYCAHFSDKAVYLRWPLVLLFTLSTLLQALRLPGLTVITAAGHFKETRLRAVAEAAVNLIVSIALIRPLGICGVLIGTCASYLYRTADVIVYAAKRFLPGSLGLSARRLARNALTGGAVAAAGLALIPGQMESWLIWLGWAAVCGAAATAAFCLVNWLFEPREFCALLSRFPTLPHPRKRV